MDRTQRVGRRHFLRSSGRAIAGLAGLLAGQPPAAWAARELSLLTAVSYAPTSDVKLAELGKRFSKLAGASVRIDHIQSVQMSAKLSSQLMSRSGHDIISLEMHYPWLFAPGLVDVSDICTDLARKHGEWYSFAREHAYSGSRSPTSSSRFQAAIGSTCSSRSARNPRTRGMTCCGP